MAPRRFAQVDVFTSEPLRGNPVAVVLDADGLDDATMQRFARWTNLSETTFVLPPTVAGADYRVRIFTPGRELPFAGHPTIGSAHAWLEAGGSYAGERVIQECGVGLVPLRRTGGRLAFAAPPPRRSEPLPAPDLVRICSALGIDPERIVDHRLLDNGPVFATLLLGDAADVLAIAPDLARLGDTMVGVAGTHRSGGSDDPLFEVRMFAPGIGVPEDPVTGAFNAALAQWLIASERAPSSYVAAQGTAIDRAGRVHIDAEGDDVWVGGDAVTCVAGTVTI